MASKINSDRDVQAQRQPYGGLVTRWKLRPEITQIDETFDLTGDRSLGAKVVGGLGEAVKWAVRLPSWCTGCRVHFVRYVVATNKGGVATAGGWIEESYRDFTTGGFHYMTNDDDYVWAYVDNIAGTPAGGTGVEILYKSARMP